MPIQACTNVKVLSNDSLEAFVQEACAVDGWVDVTDIDPTKLPHKIKANIIYSLCHNTSAEIAEKYLDNPSITVDVTNYWGNLPAVVRAGLLCMDESFESSTLREANVIHLWGTKISVPGLGKVEHIFAPNAVQIDVGDCDLEGKLTASAGLLQPIRRSPTIVEFLGIGGGFPAANPV